MSISKNIGRKYHFSLMSNHVTFNYKILENFVDDNVERDTQEVLMFQREMMCCTIARRDPNLCYVCVSTA